MKPRVALVFPTTISPKSFFGFLLPSLGLERLGAAIEDIADVELFDARFEKDLVEEVRRFRPTVIALNIKTTMYCQRAYDMAAKLHRALPEALMVGGGLHATACPAEALQFCEMIIRGEGERSFRLLIQGTSKERIPGLAYRGADNEPVINEMASPLEDLDILEPPARHLRKPHYSYSAAGLFPMDLLETSRGCTHACTFCSPGSVYPHKYRQHSPEYVIREIRRMADAGVKYCMLTDDHFGGSFERVERICDLIIESDIRITFFCFIRPFAGNMDLKRKMARAGFVLLSYGAESPSPEQLENYGKGYPAGSDFLGRVNSEWLEAGACYIGNSYVFGDVDDGLPILQRMGDHARGLDPTYIEPLYSQPYPGTIYREKLKERGLLLNKKWSDFTEGTLLVRHPDLDSRGMAAMRAAAWLRFFSPKKASGIVRVPLHLHLHSGVERLKVLAYMKACDYSVFGCVLETPFYAHLHMSMVKHYFRYQINKFEASEMDMSCQGKLDQFMDVFGMAPLKKIFGERRVLIKVKEGTKTLATLESCFSQGRLIRAMALAGDTAPRTGDISIPVPLWCLALAMGAPERPLKALGRILILGNAVALDIPRRFLVFLDSMTGSFLGRLRRYIDPGA